MFRARRSYHSGLQKDLNRLAARWRRGRERKRRLTASAGPPDRPAELMSGSPGEEVGPGG